MAGVGNVYKSEVLFVERVDPFARVADLVADRRRQMSSGPLIQSAEEDAPSANRRRVARASPRNRLAPIAVARADFGCTVWPAGPAAAAASVISICDTVG